MPIKGKCFSTCRRRPKSECDPPECYYTNGQKYKYCRLAFTRKMNADCEPVLRIKRGNVKSVTKKNVTFTKNARLATPIMNLNPSRSKIEAFRKKHATRKIDKFLRTNNSFVRAKFLQSVCSDAGVCIAFGQESAMIRRHFNDFSNFNLLSKPAKTIGAVSANGFVKELTYEHRGYVANAILKSTAESHLDNLLYEAMVGMYLNKQNMRFPSFVETYGLYQYAADGLAYTDCKTRRETASTVLQSGLKRIAQTERDLTDNKILESCMNSKSMCALIQHLKGATTLRSNMDRAIFVQYDLLYALFQVYMTLACLSDEFTHYDLHYENVLLYEPVKGGHIEYHYHLSKERHEKGREKERHEKDSEKETIVFRSQYIAKIIDYGRSYFKNGASSSLTFHERLCKICDNCGYKTGYGWLEYNKNTIKQSYYISSQVNNPSHDLRLLAILGADYNTFPANLSKFMKRVVYNVNVPIKKNIFGTVPNPVSGFPNKINNVTDAFYALRELVQDPAQQIKNLNKFSASKKLGELHIYDDGRAMKYVPV